MEIFWSWADLGFFLRSGAKVFFFCQFPKNIHFWAVNRWYISYFKIVSPEFVQYVVSLTFIKICFNREPTCNWLNQLLIYFVHLKACWMLTTGHSSKSNAAVTNNLRTRKNWNRLKMFMGTQETFIYRFVIWEIEVMMLIVISEFMGYFWQENEDGHHVPPNGLGPPIARTLPPSLKRGGVLLGFQKWWGVSRIWKLKGHLFRSGHLVF